MSCYSEKINKLPSVIDDIDCWFLMQKDNQKVYIIGSISKDRYIKVYEKNLEIVMSVLKSFDGKSSMDQIDKMIKAKYGKSVDVNKIYLKAEKAGLICGSSGSNEKSELKALSLPVFSINIPTLNNRIKKIIRALWRIYVVLGIIIILIGVLVLIKNGSNSILTMDRAISLNNSYLMGFVVTSLMMAPSLFMHEISHFAAAISSSLDPSKVSMNLYLGIIPIWYVKIPGIYTIKLHKRIMVLIAGVFTNFVIASAALIVTFYFKGSFGNDFLLKMGTANFFAALFSFNPFTLSDGYFIFTTLLKKPNLRFNVLNKIMKPSLKTNRLNFYDVIYILAGIIILACSLFSTFWWGFNIVYEIFAKILKPPFEYYATLLFISSVSVIAVTGMILKGKNYMQKV